MKFRLIFIFVIWLSLGFGAAFSQGAPEPDAEGCKDSALMTRMPGCRIEECSGKEFDSAELQVGSGELTKSLEGQTEIITYVCPLKLSTLQIVRNAENALRKAGFTIVYSGKGSNGQPLVTAQKGGQWMEMVGITGWPDNSAYTQTAVKLKEMAQELAANADAMAEEINKSGHVAVYGINFDTGKATLKPDSEKVLGEILTLLKKNSAWKLRVEGHTDNVGSKASNQTLSEQRAASVVAWLVKNGIAKARLTAQGFGDSKPVADNKSDEGRAKNRRVELAKL